MKKPSKKPTERFTVELIKAHSHAGTDYQPSESITVSRQQAQWLAERGIIAEIKLSNEV
ncbi:MAG: hypothetical protein KGZ88_11815 [Methylomicrobium sp.]|nr:hypothetical protein [Methylomicrobium sp.]